MTAPGTGIGVMYGMSSTMAAGTDTHEASVKAVTTGSDAYGNPFLWLAGVAAVTFGLIGFSASARVGKFAAGVKAG